VILALLEAALSTTALRDSLPSFTADSVSALMSELGDSGYSCSLLFLPHPVIRVSHKGAELDIVLRAAYADVLGERVPYADVPSAVSRVFAAHDLAN